MPELDLPDGFKKRLDKKAKKHPHLVHSILECVYRIAQDPHHPGLHTRKVKGVRGVFESRVDGANRVTWEWRANGVILIRNHCNHDIVATSP